MISNRTIRGLAAASVSIPTFAASPAVAKDTVYMPSHIAARTLGRGTPVRDAAARGEPERDSSERDAA